MYILLLFCCFQMTGINVYAQEPAKKIQMDSLLQARPAPQARARRHREQTQEKLPTDSTFIQKKTLSLQPIDSISAAGIDVATTDSLEKVNQENLKKLESATSPVIRTDTIPPVIPKKVFTPNPTTATWLALVIPGGGQIYNRKYWKLPIIYGGFAGCAYALSWNSKTYKDYSQAYQDLMDDNPSTNSYMNILPAGTKDDPALLKEKYGERFRKSKDTYRRYRDLSIFALIGVYLISVIDAYVDAELSNFDITPDLSMRVEPAIINDQYRPGNKSVGVHCSLRF